MSAVLKEKNTNVALESVPRLITVMMMKKKSEMRKTPKGKSSQNHLKR